LSPLYGVNTAGMWELQASIFSPAMHFEQYFATPRVSLANRNGFAKVLIMVWLGCGIKTFY